MLLVTGRNRDRFLEKRRKMMKRACACESTLKSTLIIVILIECDPEMIGKDIMNS